MMEEKKMKRTICMIAVLLLFNLTHRAFAEEITVRLTNGEWPPYQSEHLVLDIAR